MVLWTMYFSQSQEVYKNVKSGSAQFENIFPSKKQRIFFFVRCVYNYWIISGIVSVASITTAMGAFGTMVDDRMRKSSKDFYSAPVKRSEIVSGYILSAFVIGLVMCLLTFILGEAYIFLTGGKLLSPLLTIKFLAVMLLSVSSSSCIVFFIKNTGAFTTASTILGSLIGFLTGIYLPIGTLPEGVQWIVKLFPVSHAGALMRQIMLKDPIAVTFNAVPETYIEEFKAMMGVTYSYGDYTASPIVHILLLFGVSVLFFLLAVWNVSRKKI